MRFGTAFVSIVSGAVALMFLSTTAQAQRVEGVNCYENGRYVFYEGRSTCPSTRRAAPPPAANDDGAYAESQRRTAKARELNEIGLKAWNNQDWAGAAEYFRQALEFTPDDTVIKDNLAKANRKIELEEEERQRKEREAREAEEKFQRDKADALNTLKDTSSPLQLKDVDTIKSNDTSSFGLKGVGDTGIKDIKPDTANRANDLNTSWKRLNYAFAIGEKMQKAYDHLDLVETKYLATESLRALNGEELGIKLDIKIPPMDNVKKDKVDQSIAGCRTLLQNVITQIDKTQAQKNAAQAPNAQHPTEAVSDTSKTAATETKQETPKTNTPKSTDDKRIADAYAQQKAFQAKEEARIKDIVKQKEDTDDAVKKALAALAAGHDLDNAASSTGNPQPAAPQNSSPRRRRP